MTTILLTGASRGIGAAARTTLAARGCTVIGQSTAGGDGLLAADFTDPAAPGQLWDAALEQAGGSVDVLVNNAGLFRAAPLDMADAEWSAAWGETLRINLDSAAELSRRAVRHWQQRGSGGRIVHVASRAGHRGDSPAHWHYAASKGAMLALHKTIARAYAAENILSFAITPGLADIPLGRVATPEEIAGIIAWCALDAPPSLTGATLDANGASYVR
ncbi:MAG: 3-oxoacyl-ACP reductase [Pelagerythrobacter marensis]|nr:MAG: 3-oxoacyl-ACP reductase [Pelagerythrobacter marensis]